MLDRRRDALVVRSPQRGRVLTWNPIETLSGQPVRRGQALLTVADPSGPWIAELRIDEDEAGYVRSAIDSAHSAANDRTLTIEVRAASVPDDRMAAKLITLAERSEHDPVWGTGLRAEARLIETPATATLGPGTAASARIPCGRRPLGFVWFRDVIDAWRNW
ncbi:MAG: HlyD family efflux transporter periplasmic adaptor subunit [Pirellulales bacterium]